ncbi:hypothetical protein NQ622_17490 [Acinetobacter baumannii]|uniref:hypothetical protein n=1 Tax=Acinetobacter baumannii TaxID=470 RepID=UPI001B9286E1|nr:hypothetical protein [Acinetobacter baumannii]MBR8606203.1 hypothetical protein [Acinetobacter baumannii]MDC4255739.1 hypothetical protein [Acinetobacter baumannii]MDC4470271.1 hypothetical protein [Acinetobacter baumannii]MDC5593697.1 hypothetical protein [Acinetobacter baumannii]MDC5651154.1 hypothetical protein [Acinetobacter baumannii]
MSTEHIIFSQDKAKSIEERWTIEYLNSSYWDAFGDLLDEVLLPNYPQLHESIKSEEGQYLKFYTFEELDRVNFNLSIKLIRQYLKYMKIEDWGKRDYITDMAKWQNMASQVWEDIVERYVVRDSRYDTRLASIE